LLKELGPIDRHKINVNDDDYTQKILITAHKHYDIIKKTGYLPPSLSQEDSKPLIVSYYIIFCVVYFIGFTFLSCFLTVSGHQKEKTWRKQKFIASNCSIFNHW
jgi:hypothetical protein